jgi:putative transposase
MIGRTGKQRKRLRLKEYDYSQPGAYFVTICTKNREERFGEIVSGEMHENEMAAVVHSCWKDLPNHYPNMALDAFVVMPNHVHGIVVILDESIPVGEHPMPALNQPAVGASSALRHTDNATVGARHASPQQRRRNTLGDVVGSFKSAVTKRINEIANTPGTPFWQRGYYDHIIRDGRSLTRIREYIAHNPQHWASDKQNSNAAEFEKHELASSHVGP